MATYILRYFFDPGAGACTWAGNAPATTRYGYAVVPGSLPITENLQRRLAHLCAWFDTSIDWRDPTAHSPWSWTEVRLFREAADSALDSLAEELGPDFQISDERTPFAGSPALGDVASTIETMRRLREIQILVNLAQPDPVLQPTLLTDGSSLLDFAPDPDTILRARLEAALHVSVPMSLSTPVWQVVDHLRRARPGWPEE